MTLSTFRNVFFSALFIAISFVGYASENPENENGKEFNAKEMIMHHVKDAHEYHPFDWNGKPVTIALPIILWTDQGLVTFMSSEFHHDDSGTQIVERDGARFVKYHEKIYQLDASSQEIVFDEAHYPANASLPLDFSITRNVFMMWVSVIVLLLIFLTSAKVYKKSNNKVPTGIAGFTEPLIVFVRDEIAKPMIGDYKYKKYMPYLLTIFFFIWINNIFGLIPFLNGANVSGNIAFTLTLAAFTFIITTISGNKNYWKHIFWMPGVPVPMKIFLMPIEIVGMFVKPISLTIRLFANITAGHIIILSLMALIFIFESIAVAPVSVAFSLFILLIEIVVTAIQAYIFTVLSALYIGMATEEEH
ncbi:F0F1 ATP synthase subunit A [Xanthomarina sp. F2636L]|uniref:F0F1 ATP synthase subunit A n=1 Tax=Xanthomarina sp. F2636L TaxID=2996018 RepID=UPI00225DF2ED|nr:F0F1 ATP synthase subunit A [Xanthomarina sp. F2636L]MCX7551358.1 F0F1 ATP synthase subunit A [Xanthomarina sp. F2636L]